MATHSRVLFSRIPGTGEPSGLLSMGLHRVGHDWSDLAAAAAAAAAAAYGFINFGNKKKQKKNKKTSVAEDMEKRERNAALYNCYEKSKVLKSHYSYSDMYSMEVKSRSQRDKCAPLFIAALFTTAKICKQPTCSPAGEWIKMWYIWYYVYEKDGNSDV